MYFEESGAYTGEIAPAMLVDAGVKYVVLGHSERRDYFGETNEDVNKKVLKAFEHGITPIMCCGETLEQREQGVTMDLIRQQVKVGLQGVTADQAKTMSYRLRANLGLSEQVKQLQPKQAQEICKGIRECIAEIYDDRYSRSNPYPVLAGSVNAGNAPENCLHWVTSMVDLRWSFLKPDFGRDR